MDTKNFNISGFKRIHIKFAMEAEIVRGDDYSVSVSGSDTLIDNIDVYLEGDKLVLGYNLNLISLFAAPFTRARARIVLPELRELKIVGAARCSLHGFNSADDFNLQVAGASRLEIDEMSVGNTKWELAGASHLNGRLKVQGNMGIKVSGASRVRLAGSAADLDLDASGASHFELEELALKNARVRLVGASRGLVKVEGKLEVELEGASNLEYLGQATLGDVKVSGASTIRRKN
jgi:hypothetical protein